MNTSLDEIVDLENDNEDQHIALNMFRSSLEVKLSRSKHNHDRLTTKLALMGLQTVEDLRKAGIISDLEVTEMLVNNENFEDIMNL